jgi:hypothetical protein
MDIKPAVGRRNCAKGYADGGVVDVVPNAGAMVPDRSRMIPNVGAMTPDFGKMIPNAAQFIPSPGKMRLPAVPTSRRYVQSGG